MAALMGIDIGTLSVKVDLMDDRGESWSSSSSPYIFQSPQRGWAEQRPEVWWDAAQEAVAAVWSKAGLGDDASITVGFTGQMHTTVLLDVKGQPVRPAVLWCDSRAAAQARSIAARMPDMASITGNAPLAAFTLSHLLWLREHEPANLSGSHTVLMPKDYLRYRVTGVAATDWTDASGTNMLDMRSRAWSPTVLEASQVDPSLLPLVVPSAEMLGPIHDLLPGRVRAEAVAGLGDEFAEAVSAGAVDPGPLVVILGTSGALVAARDRPADGVFCHAPADRWLRLDSLHSAGLSLTWARDVLAPGTPFDTLLAEAAAVDPGAEGLTFLPFLTGDRFANGGGAPAGFLGMRPVHSRGHLIRAVLEGVALELRRIATTRMDNPRPSSIVLKGGGAQSPLWADIISEVFDTPVSVSTRTAASGALDVAGVAAKWWTYTQAAQRQVHQPRDPSEDRAILYEELFAGYCELVAKLDQ